MRLVDATHQHDRLACPHPGEDPHAEVGLVARFADVVAGADLGRTDAALAVGGQRLIPHACPDLPLAGVCYKRRVLGHRPVDGAVAVQIAQGHQYCATVLGRGDEVGVHRRPVLHPPVVRRIDAVVDHRCVLRGFHQRSTVGRICADALHSGDRVPGAADQAYGSTLFGERGCQAGSDLSGPDDHVLVHHSLLCEHCSQIRALLTRKQEHCSHIVGS